MREVLRVNGGRGTRDECASQIFSNFVKVRSNNKRDAIAYFNKILLVIRNKIIKILLTRITFEV